jgi:phage/plasmid-like protein (TIGR03299 family)
MAHELSFRADGSVEMAFRQGTAFPWHFNETHPQIVPEDASIDDWIKAAGMDWSIEAAPVQFSTDGMTFAFKDRHVLHRSDNLEPLAIVSDEYHAVDPAECLCFFNDLIEAVGLKLDTAGVLFGGRRWWALASVGQECLIDNRDLIKGYVLLSSSADGKRATECRHTSVRVVCANTLSLSDRKDSASQIRVTHRSEFIPDEVKRRLGIAPKSFADFMTGMRKLADRRITHEQAESQVRKLLGAKQDDKAPRLFKQAMQLFDGLATGYELPGMQGTAYGLLQSITEAADWESKAKSDSHRLANAFMGPAEGLKIKARDQLLELVR